MPTAERLTQLRRYEDPRNGIFEEFVERRLGPNGALALLSAPLADRRSLGWLICPSIGPEHGNLRRLEALIARRLAAVGSPVLRIRPDADSARGVFGEIDLSVRLREVEEAVAVLSAESGVEAVGLLGILFGGTVAALACERLDLPAMALIEPAARGRQYLRETMRRHAVAELMAAAEAGEHEADTGLAQRPMRELSTAGHTTLQGLRLTRAEYERISAVDLVSDLQSFSGRSLLVGISPTGAVAPGLRKLQERLASLGGDVTVSVVDDPLPAPLGEYYYRNVGVTRVDTRLELDRRLADLAAAWVLDESAVRAPAEIV
jgi:hypothetical protein